MVSDNRSRGLLQIYEPVLENSPRTVSGTWEEAEKAVKIFYKNISFRRKSVWST